MKILIVEDDEISAKIMTRHLKKCDYATTVLADGESCLKTIESEVPSLILLDHMLPGISGLEVLKVIRAKYSMVEVPIILVTAKTDTKDVITALRQGANDYITKPVNFDILTARIKTQLQLQRYYQDSLRKQELETLNNMIVTYNHEINSPLLVASINLEILEKSVPEKKSIVKKAMSSLSRISDILGKIKKVTKGPVEKETYVGGTKMIDIHKNKKSS